MLDYLIIGLRDGLIWFPFVLGAGLLYAHLRCIDVSIDGVVMLSGIVCAFVWGATHSYLASIGAAVIVGAVLSISVCMLIEMLEVPSLLAGLIFSLAAQSIAVLWIGESKLLPGTRLFPNFLQISWWLFAQALLAAASTGWFFRTRLGLEVRKLGDGITANTRRSPKLLTGIAFGISGSLYGLGAALYAHSEGLARAGGGFDVLVVALCAFLCVDRLVALLVRLSMRRNLDAGGVLSVGQTSRAIIGFWSGPSAKALLGAIFFQTLAFIVVAKTPNPVYWKLVFSVLLLGSLVNVRRLFKWGVGGPPPFVGVRSAKIDRDGEQVARIPGDRSELLEDGGNALSVVGLTISYELGIERRIVFENASVAFASGLTLLTGPNGAGKSTLLKVIQGALDPSSGEVRYAGASLLDRPSHRRPVFLIRQDPFQTISPALSLTENLIASLPREESALRRITASQVLARLARALEVAGLSLQPAPDAAYWHKPARTLSGGQAHVIAIYCALLSESSILLCDEPTTGLDDANFQTLEKLLTVLARHKIIVVTTHDDRLRRTFPVEYRVADRSVSRAGRAQDGIDRRHAIALETTEAPSPH